MDADVRAFEAVLAHPRAENLTPRGALAVLATIRAARGGYPENLAQCIGWGADLLQRHPYLRSAVEQEGPEQWAYHLRLTGLRQAQARDFPQRLDSATARIVAALTDAHTTGALFRTPQEALDYMNRVNLSVDLLNEDVRRSGIARRDAAFYWSWNDWRAIWRQFYQDHLPWHARLYPDGVYEETEVKERELMDWRKGFESRGGQPTAPAPQGPGGGGDDKPPTLGDIGMKLAQGAIVVAGIGVVGYVLTRNL
jgi:hypothetical protein